MNRFRIVALLSAQSPGGRKRPPTTTAAAPRHRPAVVEDEEASDQLQQENECPEPNGFFADASQCDKYYACSDNKITEKLCPDGMVFNDYSSQQEKCDLPLNIDCSQRPALRKYKPMCINVPNIFKMAREPRTGSIVIENIQHNPTVTLEPE